MRSLRRIAPVSSDVSTSTIRRAKLGDIDAFSAIVGTYYPRALRFAQRLLHDPDDAEDVVQETFTRVYQALPRYEERQRFEPWLFQILGNCCRTANSTFRREAARTVHDRSLLDRIPANAAARTPLDDEWGLEVQRALAEIPERNREIFLLHYIEDFSYDEIERMTGIKQSALKMRVKRASDLLRERLRSYR